MGLFAIVYDQNSMKTSCLIKKAHNAIKLPGSKYLRRLSLPSRYQSDAHNQFLEFRLYNKHHVGLPRKHFHLLNRNRKLRFSEKQMTHHHLVNGVHNVQHLISGYVAVIIKIVKFKGPCDSNNKQAH